MGSVNDPAGQPRKTEYMTPREGEQFCHVVGNALLKEEQPSKTLWFDPEVYPEDKDAPLTDYKIIGVSKGSNVYPLFDAELANGQKVVLYPEQFLPAEMKDLGCPYTEKEYGIPLSEIPKPINVRGLFGWASTREQELKEQARKIAERGIGDLCQKLCNECHLTPKDAARMVRKTAANIRQSPWKDAGSR